MRFTLLVSGVSGRVMGTMTAFMIMAEDTPGMIASLDSGLLAGAMLQADGFGND